MRTIAAALFILAAQQTSADRSIRDFMTERAKLLERDFLPDVKTSADFEKLRPTLHQQYLDMLGLWPGPEKTALKAPPYFGWCSRRSERQRAHDLD